MNNMFFYKGKENIFEKSKTQNIDNNADSNKKKMQEEFLKFLDNKNLSFLLGSGCSSHKIEKDGTDGKEYIQIGVPVMCPLATEFYASNSFSKYRRWLKLYFKIDVESEDFKTNLETFLSTLHSVSFYYSKSTKNDNNKKTIAVR